MPRSGWLSPRGASRAFAHPDGTHALVITKPDPASRGAVRMAGNEADVDLPGDSMATLTCHPSLEAGVDEPN